MTNIERTTNDLSKKQIKISDISHIKGYLYIIFDNGQKVVTNEKELYDVSEFGYIHDIFTMGDKLCAVFINGYNPCLLDLNTREILFDDMNAYSISKQDDKTLHVIMKSNEGNNIYDIERKMYLPKPEGYEFENSLGNGLYVFSESDIKIPFYEKKRCVINSDLYIVLNNIRGWIYYENGYLIVHKDKALTILEVDEAGKVKSIKTVEKNDDILTSPEYYEGWIIIVLKNKINVYKPDLELIKSIPVEGLEEVTDSERIGDVLKLCVPTIYNGNRAGKHIFVNVKTGRKLEHLRINGYPYWTQEAFVGQDELEDYQKSIDFYFYDKDFNFITKENGIQCYSADDENESLFIVESNGKKVLINTENGSTRETDYILVRYHFSVPYGYGVHKDDETMDFFDKNLKVIIPNFNFREYDLDFSLGGFGYFIVNSYVCITADYVDGYGQYQYRKIIYSSDGNVILDSIEHKCYPIGNYIQIMKDKESQFLNTLTGDIGELSINAHVDKMGRIDFSRINNFSDQLVINNRTLMLEEGEGSPNIKKLIPDN